MEFAVKITKFFYFYMFVMYQRMHVWWSSRTLYLLLRQVGFTVTVGDSGLSCCVRVTSIGR